MSPVFLLVFSIWILPQLFKGLDLVIEDGVSNVTIFESFLQENETNSTTVLSLDETTTSFPDRPFTSTIFLTNLSSDDSFVTDIPSPLDSTTTEGITTFHEDDWSTLAMTSSETQATVETTIMRTSESPITQPMPQARPEPTYVAVTEISPAILELYGEACGLEGLQCDASVKCRGRGKIICNIKEEVRGGRTNVSITDEESTKEQDSEVSAPRTVPECRVVGKVICLPIPTISNCKGDGECVPVSEQNLGAGILKDWEIAVITVLCVVGLLLIFLMVYILYSSFKKLKVRPDEPRYPSAQSA